MEVGWRVDEDAASILSHNYRRVSAAADAGASSHNSTLHSMPRTTSDITCHPFLPSPSSFSDQQPSISLPNRGRTPSRNLRRKHAREPRPADVTSPERPPAITV